MPRPDLYLLESKSSLVCIQILLEFVIFLIAALLWLTWCTQHLKAATVPEEKSLGFSLPGYIQGWTCLMIARLFSSRLKEKFCFSFYMASGIRFMASAAILFPQFSASWFPAVYGMISLLCFVTTIFIIVTQTKPATRQVRRLIGPDGTKQAVPVNEMMTVKQLENYRDEIRNYVENLKNKEDSSDDNMPYFVRSVSVITVPLRDSGHSVLADSRSNSSNSDLADGQGSVRYSYTGIKDNARYSDLTDYQANGRDGRYSNLAERQANGRYSVLAEGEASSYANVADIQGSVTYSYPEIKDKGRYSDLTYNQTKGRHSNLADGQANRRYTNLAQRQANGRNSVLAEGQVSSSYANMADIQGSVRYSYPDIKVNGKYPDPADSQANGKHSDLADGQANNRPRQ